MRHKEKIELLKSKLEKELESFDAKNSEKINIIKDLAYKLGKALYEYELRSQF